MLLPDDFTKLMRQHLGATAAESLLKGLDGEAVVSVRLNPLKADIKPELEPVSWCPYGYYLTDRRAFTFDPLFHAGVYYVQEASSMYLHEVLRQYKPEGDVVALDLCAAPGGKGTLLSSCLSEGSLLVCNEPVRSRAQVLAENMAKWGNPSCVVTQNVPEDFCGFVDTFDLILADVPCSGEGMFRKEEQARSEWSLENVDMCWHRQRDIVSSIWCCLKPGGLFIYSTCTFNTLENEENVSWIASELHAEILHQRRFLPGRDKGEGFFIAALRKGGTLQPNSSPPHKPAKIDSLRGDFVLISSPLTHTALPARHAELIEKMLRSLRVLSSGVKTEESRGKDWLPSHSLALSTAYIRGAYPEASISYEQAISYLRHDTLRINAPKGIVLVTYKNHPLGFVKNLGSRANNLYPIEWRIRSTHTPATPPSII